MIQGRSKAGVVQFNRTFPIWELGCRWFWRPQGNARRFQSRGGVDALTPNYSGTDDYGYFDPGIGKYVRQNPVTEVVIPKDGLFTAARTNRWDSTLLSARGYTFQPGLSTSNPALTADHIMHTSWSLPNLLRIDNSSGGALRMGQDRATSASFSTIVSQLVKRTDGGVVDSSICSAAIWDHAGAGGYAAPQLATNLRFYRVRDDGWYIVAGEIGTVAGGPTRRMGLIVEDGAEILVEAPQTEIFGASFGFPTQRIPTTGATDRSRDEFHMDRTINGGALALSRSGWMGVTIIPQVTSGAVTMPTSTILNWEVDSANFIRFLLSNTFQTVVFQVQDGGVSQAFLDVATADFVQGRPLGLAATWGQRQGSPYFFLCANGSFAEVDATGTFPTGSTAIVEVGGDVSVDGEAANVFLQAAAVGDRALHRNDCRALSKWFERRANRHIQAL